MEWELCSFSQAPLEIGMFTAAYKYPNPNTNAEYHSACVFFITTQEGSKCSVFLCPVLVLVECMCVCVCMFVCMYCSCVRVCVYILFFAGVNLRWRSDMRNYSAMRLQRKCRAFAFFLIVRSFLA